MTPLDKAMLQVDDAWRTQPNYPLKICALSPTDYSELDMWLQANPESVQPPYRVGGELWLYGCAVKIVPFADDPFYLQLKRMALLSGHHIYYNYPGRHADPRAQLRCTEAYFGTPDTDGWWFNGAALQRINGYEWSCLANRHIESTAA